MARSFLIVAGQVGVLFLLMAAGYLCNRLRILKEDGAGQLADLVLYAVTPCLIVSAFQRDYDPRLLGGLARAAAAGIGLHALAIPLAALCIRCADKGRERVLRFAAVFPNAGFMAVPLQQALLGGEGVFYGAAIIAVFNLFVWSYGLALMDGGWKAGAGGVRRMLLNPGTIGICCGLPLFLFRLRLPPVLSDAVSSIAGLNTPLAMIVVGFYLAEAGPRLLPGGLPGLAALFLRLAAVPAAVAAAMKWACPGNPTLAVAAVIAAASPAAAMTAMFAAKFKRDTRLAVGLVAGSTLLSLATLPLIVGWARWLFGG